MEKSVEQALVVLENAKNILNNPDGCIMHGSIMHEEMLEALEGLKRYVSNEKFSLALFANANPHFRLFLPDGSPGMRVYRAENLVARQALQAEARLALDGGALAPDFWERVESVPFEVA